MRGGGCHIDQSVLLTRHTCSLLTQNSLQLPFLACFRRDSKIATAIHEKYASRQVQQAFISINLVGDLGVEGQLIPHHAQPCYSSGAHLHQVFSSPQYLLTLLLQVYGLYDSSLLELINYRKQHRIWPELKVSFINLIFT